MQDLGGNVVHVICPAEVSGSNALYLGAGFAHKRGLRQFGHRRRHAGGSGRPGVVECPGPVSYPLAVEQTTRSVRG